MDGVEDCVKYAIEVRPYVVVWTTLYLALRPSGPSISSATAACVMCGF